MEARHEEQVAALDFDAMAEDIGDEILVWAPNLPEVSGRTQVREWQRAWEEAGSFESYDLTVDEVIGCGDLAFVKGMYAWDFLPKGAADPTSDSGRWFHLLRKNAEGNWVIIRDAFNSALPLPTG